MTTMPSTAVHGVVVDAKGRPVMQARVGWVDGPVALPDVMALTDAQGRFTLSAPVPGAYRLHCGSVAHGERQLPVQVGGASSVLRVVLPA